jgi:hypothetical protein
MTKRWIRAKTRRIEPIPVKGALGVFGVGLNPAILWNGESQDGPYR